MTMKAEQTANMTLHTNVVSITVLAKASGPSVLGRNLQLCSTESSTGRSHVHRWLVMVVVPRGVSGGDDIEFSAVIGEEGKRNEPPERGGELEHHEDDQRFEPHGQGGDHEDRQGQIHHGPRELFESVSVLLDVADTVRQSNHLRRTRRIRSPDRDQS